MTKTTFDNLNRPTNVSYLKDGTSETLSYEPAGNLIGVANATVSYTLGYDTLNRLTSKVDSRGRSLGFTWDKSGHVLTKTTYQGSTTSYTYDGAGTLVSLSNPDYLSVNYQYDNAGRLLSRVMSSGARSLYVYDSGGWLQSLTHTDAVGATVTSQSYTRDRVGNITAINQTAGPIIGSTAYTLDALYRLTQVDAPGTANDEAFSYDHLGNRLIATRGSTTVGTTGTGITSKYSLYTAATQTGTLSGYTPNNNNRLKEIRLGSVGGTIDAGFTFDNEGRLTGQTGTTLRTLTWDAKGRLKTLLQAGSTETYSYDPSNHRIRRSGGSLGTLDYYLEGEHLESVEQSGSLTEKYFRGSTIDELVAGYTTQSGKLTPFFFQHDQVMSVAAETKPNGGTQATLAYFAFGESQVTTGTPISRLKYTGREDEGNALYFYRARYYDPKFGFVSEDPKRFAAGPNFYAYVSNNPVNANDPTGMIAGIDNLIGAGVNVALGFGLTCAISSCSNYGWKQAGVDAVVGFATSGLAVLNAARRAAQIEEGIYVASKTVKTGLPYVGQSGNIAGRLETHVSTGKITENVASNAKVYEVLGGKTSREVAEQRMVNKLGGVDSLENVVNPIGSSRSGLLDDWSLGAITNSNALNWSGVVAADLGYQFGSYSPPAYGGTSGSAAGGFLLYPNKPNTNQMQSVYSK